MANFFIVFLACFLLTSENGMAEKIMEDGGGGAAAMAKDELSALFDVVGALLQDPSWAEYHPHPCTDTPWPGVQCELVQGQGQEQPLLHVTKLHIGPDVAAPPCKASAKFSKSLLNLPYLKTFSLFNCFLAPGSVSLPPYLFTNTSSLEQLVLKSNPGVTGQIPASIGNLANLRVLSLSQNNINGLIPKELGDLGSLEQLDLSYNNLTGEIPGEIGGLRSLGILDLCSNKIQGEIPSSMGQLKSLQKLDLSSNNLSGKIPSDLGKLEKLVLLDLSYNSLTGPLPGTFSAMKELQYFMIEGNPIGTTIPQFVGELSQLSVLGFSGCGFTGPIPPSIGTLRNLTALSLDRNMLSGSVPPTLGTLPKLGALNLSQNQLSGEIVFSDEFVNRLGKRLDVRDNKRLCTDPQKYQSPSLYLDAPPCLDAAAKSSSSSGEIKARPTAGDGESSSIKLPYSNVRVFLFVHVFVILMQLY